MQLRECLLALMFTIQRRIELKPFAGTAAEVVMTVDDIDWMARIVWSSQ